MSQDKPKNTYPCPCCKNALVWSSANEFRPFCSAQCKNKDLVDWAHEQHVIAGSSVFDDLMSDDLSAAQMLNEQDSNVYSFK